MPSKNALKRVSSRKSEKSIKRNQSRIVKKRQQNEKKKNTLKKLQLCDLPTEILEKIIGNIHIWHRNRIRATCKRLKNVCDGVLMHEFKSSMQKYGRKSRTSYEYVALAVINQATWAYVKAGYCPLFLGAMLPLMRNNYQNPFCPQVEKIKQFLVKFYKLVEENLGNPYSQISRLLYCITLLGFMNKCKNAVLLSSVITPLNNWRAIYELKGSWLGMLHSSTSAKTCLDRNELLILLAEIMISVHTETAFKKVWEGKSKIFVCGHDTSQRTRLPKTVFTFNIYGSSEILTLLKNSPKRGSWRSLCKDEFTLTLNILCKEACKWGCDKAYQLEIEHSPHEEESWESGKINAYLQNIEKLT